MTDDSNPKSKITRLMGQTSSSQPAASSITQSGSNNIIAFGNVNLGQLQPRAPRATVPTSPGVDHITDPQKVVLKDLVDEIVATEARLKESPASYTAVWKSLNKKCGVSTYHLIALENFDGARVYLNSWLGRLNSMRSAPVKNGDAWRKKKYAYIKINSKQPDDAKALAVYIKRNFKADSITELANDELERVYRYVAGRRNKRR
jgi:hypothetical protein